MSDVSGKASVPEPLRRRALDIYRRLRALAIDLYRANGGSPGDADGFDLSLTVELGQIGLEQALATHGEAMLAELVRKTEELAAALSSYRPGRVFCFFCQQSSCAHSEPPSTASAFAGYLPTGRPRWVDFPSLALEWRDPRVEAVFTRRSEVIALVRPGPALLAQLLPYFRSSAPIYDLLGEVVIGLLPIGEGAGARHAEAAATIQVVRSLGRDGEAELRLNVLGKIPDGGSLRVYLENGGDEALARTLSIAEHEIDTINRRLRGARRAGSKAWDPDQAVDPLLRRLARRIEQIYRQRGRRTHHAQVRTEEGVRPTRKALEDARTASSDRIYIDVTGGAFVVIGPKGRVHVFSQQGRHVTSLSAGGEEVQRRIQKRRWRAATASEVASFKKSIAPADGR